MSKTCNVMDVGKMVGQTGFTDVTRRIVVDWMHEVVMEVTTNQDVWVQAVYNLDRFLCSCKITKPQLQLAAAVCLYISFKLHSLDVSSDAMAEYTDYCYSAREIVAWELLVIVKLGWRLRPLTPLALVNQVIQEQVNGHDRVGDHLRGHLTDMVLMSVGDPTLTFADPHHVTWAALELVLEESRNNKMTLHRNYASKRHSYRTPENLNRSNLEQIKNHLRILLAEDADSGYDSLCSRSSVSSEISTKDIDSLDFSILKNFTSKSKVTDL